MADSISPLSGQKGLLITQRAEVVRTAGDQQTATPDSVGFWFTLVRWRQDPEEFAGELLALRWGEVNQHLVQTIEND